MDYEAVVKGRVESYRIGLMIQKETHFPACG